MKSRKNQIIELTIQYCNDDLERKTKIFSDCFMEDKENVEKDLFSVVDDGLNEANEQSKEVRYICFFILRSSILTGSFEIMIAFYDEKLYADENPIIKYFVPSIWFDGFEKVFESIKKKLEHDIIRINRLELSLAKVNMAMFYYSSFVKTILLMIQDMMQLESAKKMQEKGQVKVFFGEYMGEMRLLYDSEELLEENV